MAAESELELPHIAEHKRFNVQNHIAIKRISPTCTKFIYKDGSYIKVHKGGKAYAYDANRSWIAETRHGMNRY